MLVKKRFGMYLVVLMVAIIALGSYAGSAQAAAKEKPDIVTMLL